MVKQVEFDPGVQKRQVTTQQTDTYYRVQGPELPAPLQTNVQRLEAALDTGISKIDAWAKKKDKEAEDAAKEQAKADYAKYGSELATRVRNGDIPENVHPEYNRTAMRMLGAGSRSEYKTFLGEKLRDTGFANKQFDTEVDASSALNAIMESSRAEFLQSKGDMGTYYLSGFSTIVDSTEAALSQEIFGERSEAAKENFKIGFQSALAGAIDDDTEDNSQVAMNITTLIRSNSGRLGLKATDMNKQATDIIGAKALELAQIGEYDDAEETLNLLGQVETSPGNYLSSTAYGKQKRRALKDQIIQMERTEERYEWSKTQKGWALHDREYTLKGQAWADKSRSHQEEQWQAAKEADDKTKMVNSKSALIVMDILTNPQKDLTADLQELTKVGGHKAVSGLLTLQKARIDASVKVTEDSVFVGELKRDVLSGAAGPEQILAAAGDHKVTVGTVKELMEDWERAESFAKKKYQLPSTVQSAFDGVSSQIQKAISASDSFNDPIKRERMGLAAGTMATKFMLEWATSEAGQAALFDPNPFVARKAINDMAAQLQKEMLDNPAMIQDLELVPEEIGNQSSNLDVFNTEPQPNPYK